MLGAAIKETPWSRFRAGSNNTIKMWNMVKMRGKHI
jgi:hypothetical protein